MSLRPPRILVISHAHPDFSLGGGEIAAYNLFRAYDNHPCVEAAYFVGRHDRGSGAIGAISLRREREYLWEQSVSDWFNMAAANIDSLYRHFSELIRRIRPTVVHAHHYIHMGLEYLLIIKKIDPSIHIVMTLHEYSAICHNQGQMIKVATNRLCVRESPEDCRQCFPNRSVEDFWMRKHRYQSFFRLISRFVAPSNFLRERYINWGIREERISTIENGQAERETLPPRLISDGETRNRFAFFGQINPYKGADVLLSALKMLKKSQRRQIVLEMHGANFEMQAEGFQDKINELRAPLEDEGTLQWHGPYERSRLANRMAEVDWVVVPSVWWENSPMVIQEAFAVGRPVVSSDIGGMGEKVTNGVDGVHVPVGSAKAWSDTLLRLAKYTGEWNSLREMIRNPISYKECADSHLRLISSLH